MMVPRLSGFTDADHAAHARLLVELAELQRMRAARREQQLQVGRGQPLAAVAEHLRAW